MTKARVSLYGGNKLLRGYCKRCKLYSIIVDGEFICCGRKAKNLSILGVEQMSFGKSKRKIISRSTKIAILEMQNNQCYWCGKDLSETCYFRSGKVFSLKTVFDHYIAWAYGRNDNKENIVAACNLCNAIKGDLVFSDENKIRKYIQDRIKAKGIRYV